MGQGSQSPQAVREFFNRQQTTNRYHALKHQTRLLDAAAADFLNAEVRGDTLTIGGIWDHFEWRAPLRSLTVLDLSPEMLKDYCPNGARGIVGDLYSHEFPAKSFDSVVFPLILHHTPQGNWQSCERRIEEAVRRARSWLKADGRVFILEYCPHPLWNPLQRGLLPVTRRFLQLFHQPLVVMYTLAFYRRTLEKTFGSCDARRITAENFNAWAWYPVFMSIDWLKMPFAFYPKMHLFTAPARP